MKKFSLWAAVAVLIGLFVAAQAPAATLHVEKWGTDSTSCGAANDPCLSISQAIYNADANSTILVGPGFYGDLNGDGDVDDPGEENAFGNDNCGGNVSAVVCINKPGLKLESTLGAAATHITAQGGDYNAVVDIHADRVKFGQRKKGFTVENGQRSGVRFRGRDIVIEAIVASSNGDDGFLSGVNTNATDTGNQLLYNRAVNNGADGYALYALGLVRHITQFAYNTAEGNGGIGVYLKNQEKVTVQRNRVVGNSNVGIYIYAAGAGTSIRDNLVQDNGGAGLHAALTYGETGIRVEGNMVIRNTGEGLSIYGRGKTIRNNVSARNTSEGFVLGDHYPAFRDEFSGNLVMMNDSVGVYLMDNCNTVSNFKFMKNNIYANDLAGGQNRGLVNSTGTTIALKHNFWGAASGPGPDPADIVFDNGTGSVTNISPARKPNKIKTKIGGF